VSSRKVPDLRQLGRYAVARSLFEPTSLPRAIARLGYVQADPMRAPARAQDLILLERVEGYRAGDLERRYPRLAIEEAFFVNYGFLPRPMVALLYPRETPRDWDAAMRARARDVLAFVRRRGSVRAREVQEHFGHGRIRRWGGDLRISAHILEGLHYRGLLRVARREAGTRVYEPAEPASLDGVGPEQRLERARRLVDAAVGLYAPLPGASVVYLCGLLRRYAAPHLAAELRQVQDEADSHYGHGRIDGVSWLWPRGENPAGGHRVDDGLRFLSPFDPVVWDRRRFHLLWGWEYKFEAYLPAHQRQRGHYAMPVLWRDRVSGWVNLKVIDGRLRHELGFAGARPRDRAFRVALEEALHRMQVFLGLKPA
jgi:uncharacterized protein YcaQ